MLDEFLSISYIVEELDGSEAVRYGLASGCRNMLDSPGLDEFGTSVVYWILLVSAPI